MVKLWRQILIVSLTTTNLGSNWLILAQILPRLINICPTPSQKVLCIVLQTLFCTRKMDRVNLKNDFIFLCIKEFEMQWERKWKSIDYFDFAGSCSWHLILCYPQDDTHLLSTLMSNEKNKFSQDISKVSSVNIDVECISIFTLFAQNCFHLSDCPWSTVICQPQ